MWGLQLLQTIQAARGTENQTVWSHVLDRFGYPERKCLPADLISGGFSTAAAEDLGSIRTQGKPGHGFTIFLAELARKA